MHLRFQHQHHNFKWEDALTCKPLDTYSEIQNFVSDPPAWRSLCKDLTPHTKQRIMNLDINNRHDTFLESPESFCHFDPDADDPVRQNGSHLPKVLICHDMANGYHDDCYIEGTGNHEAYTFYNWTATDIFCYFSHHLITIPPLSWINVAHAHGVKVIGTVITEWAEGVAFWEEIFDNDQEYKNFASYLVAIAKTLKFEGWLLNVENKILKPELLLKFVQYLHTLLHEEIPNAELIWYDSVTIQGTLNWQNGLNEKNRAYFDACDGIFTNYSWSEQDLSSSVAAAGDRLLDLYIGIDVWGRNFFGGGQFNTFEAIKTVSQYGCSMAIFAPAWTHEAMSSEKDDLNTVVTAEELDWWRRFLLRDRAFWGGIWPFLNTRLPSRLPFHTSFCKGQGAKRWLLGEVISPGPWYNLRSQQYQPNSAHAPHGYMLTNVDDIEAQPHLNRQKDRGGILRYRASFRRSRLLLLSTRREPELDLGDDEDKGDEDEDAVADDDERDEDRTESPAPRRNVKDKIRRFFHRRSRSDEAERTGEGAEDERGGAAPGTGKSMVSMSVNLRLGRVAGVKRRFRLSSVGEERECLEEWREDAFTGGSSLRVHPADGTCAEHRCTRLLHCQLPVRAALAVCVVTKCVGGGDRQYLDVLLHVRDEGGRRTRAVLRGQAGEGQEGEGVAPLDPRSDRFRAVQKYLLLHEPASYVPVENAYGWNVRYYEVLAAGGEVSSINVRAGLQRGPILLGYIGLCQLHVSNDIEQDSLTDVVL